MLKTFLAMISLLLVCQGASAAESAPTDSQFDGQRAMDLLKAQCALGPRVPGTASHQKASLYLIEKMRAVGLDPQVQRFRANPRLIGKSVQMMNIAGRMNPGQRAIVLSAHWDSRPVADKDLDAALRQAPISGANDGGSGVAVVLELARVFAQRPPECGLVFLLVDGEDLGAPNAPEEWCLGSKRFVASLDPAWNVQLAINIDMVGDAQLAFTRELYSKEMAPEFEALCWGIGRELYPQMFVGTDARRVTDDHIPFLRAGIPGFNLIDLSYPYWHTTQDTPDKCSAASLQAAGRSVEAMVRRLDAMNWAFMVGETPMELRN